MDAARCLADEGSVSISRRRISLSSLCSSAFTRSRYATCTAHVRTRNTSNVLRHGSGIAVGVQFPSHLEDCVDLALGTPCIIASARARWNSAAAARRGQFSLSAYPRSFSLLATMIANCAIT